MHFIDRATHGPLPRLGVLFQRDGSTPLHVASQNGYEAVVRSLVAAGAVVNAARSDSGGTPLHIASQKAHVHIVNALIEFGANVNQGRLVSAPSCL